MAASYDSSKIDKRLKKVLAEKMMNSSTCNESIGTLSNFWYEIKRNGKPLKIEVVR